MIDKTPTESELLRLFTEAMVASGQDGMDLRGLLCDEHGSLLSQAMKAVLLSRAATGYSEQAQIAARWILAHPDPTHFTTSTPR